MNRIRNYQSSLEERGQALVEAALFFPIFLIIIAGVVEVSQLVVTQNRVTNASRAAARFAANGGEDAGMVTVVLNSVTQTLSLDESVWDLYSVRGQVNESGDGMSEWTFVHIYGISNTTRAPNVNEAAIRSKVLRELQIDQNGNWSPDIAADLRFVAAYVIHDVDTILGLEAMPGLTGMNSVDELTVMRIFTQETEQSAGCSGFPIAVHEGVRSVTPPGTGSNPYPNAGEFTYPNNPPAYNRFVNHQPDVPLNDAREGYVYRVQNGFGAGNFGWLLWNQGRPGSANSLADSLTWPGDSTDYTDHGDNQIYPAAAAYPHVVRGYVEPGDSTDTAMHIGDWVAANTGSVNANGVRNALESTVDRERTLRLIVWSESSQQGGNGMYRITGFAIFRLIGYSLSQGQGGSWILAEFIRWDDSCGQPAQIP